MKPTPQQHAEFVEGDRLPGVAFRINDAVHVVGGEYAGRHASVIGVDSLGDDPLYLVELESGADALVRQSSLEFVGDTE